MKLIKNYVIESSTGINAAPDKIWKFFHNLESNYKTWAPEEHHYFRWTKGEPLTRGAKFDSLEIVDGHKTRIKGACIESVKNKKITFKPAWPTSIMCTKLEWIIKPREEKTLFVAKTHYKFGKLFLVLRKGTVKKIFETTQKHMNREGLNLKKIMEPNYT
ncbi:hypothetical protein SAMN05444274_106284 [Mariniphaga anaerophila]|uniref:Polyketide cyclase / dehydrase and lipid transport n=1 Tax=Mariniphaga anaerophila TaxID=1484053 RepID=A0A1M5CVK9_9BACT|nr:SRPBCC family protein [Mariniphaga anaerophila]SHF58739.1 hypothetical protein SAMN05444274_106284 [Mariniphaga anaerophila]